MNEKERRDYAQAHKDDIIDYEIPGVPVEPRSFDHIMSVRLPGYLATALRNAADARGVSVSDLLRDAAQRLVGTPIGWQCDHMNITSLPGVLGRVSAPCGCEMQPVFHNRELRLGAPSPRR